MRITYRDRRLEKLCTNEREMRRQRSDLAPKLRLRINALRTASKFGDLPTIDPRGRWHELTGQRAGTWAASVSGNWRIIVEPRPNNATAVDIIVIELIDYH